MDHYNLIRHMTLVPKYWTVRMTAKNEAKVRILKPEYVYVGEVPKAEIK